MLFRSGKYDDIALEQKKSLDNLANAGLVKKTSDYTYEYVVTPVSKEGSDIVDQLKNGISKAPEVNGNIRVGSLREIEPVVDEIVEIEKGFVKTVAEKLGINPSAAASTPVAKAVVAYIRQIISADELVELTLISNLDTLGNRFQIPLIGRLPGLKKRDWLQNRQLPVKIDAQGFVEGTGKLWNDVFSNPSQYADNLSESARRYIDRFNEIVKEMDILRESSGLRMLGKSLEDGWYYVPRQVRDINGFTLDRPSSAKMQRIFDEATEGFNSGIRYEVDPRATLQVHMRATYREIIEKQLSDFIEPSSIGVRKLVSENIQDAWQTAARKKIKAERDLRNLKNKMRVLQVGRAADPVTGTVSGTARLPRALAGAKPNYNMGQLRYTPQFESDIDKALFIVSQTKKSASDEAYMVWLREQFPNLSDAQLRTSGRNVRNHIKATLKGQPEGAVAIPLSLTAKKLTTKLSSQQPGVRTAEKTVRVSRQAERTELQKQIATAEELAEAAVKEHATNKRIYDQATINARTRPSAPGNLFGRMAVDEEGNFKNIAIGEWRKRFFAAEDVVILEKALGKLGYNPNDVGWFSRNFTNLTNVTRLLSATLDFAAPLLHGLPLLVSNPVKWGKATATHYAAWFDPTVQARFVSQNLDTFREMALYGVPIGDNEMFAALRAGDGFSPGKILEKLPKGASFRRLARETQRQSFGRFQSTYNTFLAMARASLWDGMKPSFLNNGGTRAELASFVRNLTGGLDSRALGVGPRQRAGESVWLAFSPKLLRSTIAVIADAVRAVPREALALPTRVPVVRKVARYEVERATIKQRESLKLVRKVITGVGGFYIAAGLAMGKSEREITRGLNPLNGKEFLSYEINGQWIGVGGQFRALLQFVAEVTGALAAPALEVIPGISEKYREREISALWSRNIFENPLIKGWYYRAPVGLSIAGATIEGITEGAVDILPFENIDSVPDAALHIGTSMLAFALQGILEGDNATSAIFGGLGLRTGPLTPADDVRLLRREQLDLLGIDLEWTDPNLDVRIKREIDELPGLKTALEERDILYSERGTEYSKVKKEQETINDDFKQKVEARFEIHGPGKEFRKDHLNILYAERSGALDSLRESDRYKEATEFFEEKDSATYGFNKALEEYTELIYDESLEDEILGIYNYDERSRRLENFRDKYGTTRLEDIEAYLKAHAPDPIRRFEFDLNIMRPYFEIGRNMASKYGYEKIWDKYMATAARDRDKFARHNADIRFLNDKIEEEKVRFLKGNLSTAAKLWMWGYLTSEDPVNGELDTYIDLLVNKHGDEYGILSGQSRMIIDQFLPSQDVFVR